MNYVGATKTKEGSPDWKCSDPSCKFKWDYSTKTWIPSEYITADWEPKTKPSPWPNAKRDNIAPQPPIASPTQPQGLTEGILREILVELKQINANTKKFPEPEDLSEFGA